MNGIDILEDVSKIGQLILLFSGYAIHWALSFFLLFMWG